MFIKLAKSWKQRAAQALQKTKGVGQQAADLGRKAVDVVRQQASQIKRHVQPAVSAVADKARQAKDKTVQGVTAAKHAIGNKAAQAGQTISKAYNKAQDKAAQLDDRIRTNLEFDLRSYTDLDADNMPKDQLDIVRNKYKLPVDQDGKVATKDIRPWLYDGNSALAQFDRAAAQKARDFYQRVYNYNSRHAGGNLSVVPQFHPTAIIPSGKELVDQARKYFHRYHGTDYSWTDQQIKKTPQYKQIAQQASYGADNTQLLTSNRLFGRPYALWRNSLMGQPQGKLSINPKNRTSLAAMLHELSHVQAPILNGGRLQFPKNQYSNKLLNLRRWAVRPYGILSPDNGSMRQGYGAGDLRHIYSQMKPYAVRPGKYLDLPAQLSAYTLAQKVILNRELNRGVTDPSKFKLVNNFQTWRQMVNKQMGANIPDLSDPAQVATAKINTDNVVTSLQRMLKDYKGGALTKYRHGTLDAQRSLFGFKDTLQGIQQLIDDYNRADTPANKKARWRALQMYLNAFEAQLQQVNNTARPTVAPQQGMRINAGLHLYDLIKTAAIG